MCGPCLLYFDPCLFTLALGRLGLIWPVDLMDIDRFHINFLVLGSDLVNSQYTFQY